MDFGTKHEMVKRLKKDKAKYKGAYTRTKTKLMMTMEGGMASKMQMMENLSLLSAVFEDAVRAVENLEAHYENVGHSAKLSAVASELEGLEEDFSEIERVVRGYLSTSLSHSGSLTGFRTMPTGHSAIKEQSERLKEEISRREQELNQVVHDLEKTYEECQKKLEERRSKGQLLKEQGQGMESPEEHREKVEGMSVPAQHVRDQNTAPKLR